MKSSIVRGVLLFVAGAVCATVLAGGMPGYMGADEWDMRMKAWLKEGELLGTYVIEVHHGRAYVNPEPIACPKPPQPKLPDAAVNPWHLAQATHAGAEMNQLLMLGASVMARETSRCHTIPPEAIRR